ncbi:hypothetical protein PFISCL1PPCAC_19214 [Pristionchus fissidentatus]|uniref:F-box domain-containing protein n=1 Tax=Pristionchus fissidentatus TaxID=1538716 RepID=A0AAV5WAA3_9BILA|nr:hypothetical protein PFISCL1PPCAC_19214 [Pristionchus fissidentatus]
MSRSYGSLIVKEKKELGEEFSSQPSLLDLPSEIISKIFSYLDIRSRLKFGVNRRLHQIEKNARTSLLHISDETIAKIFSYLDVRNRLKFRVNRRLNTIEKDSKFYIEFMIIEQVSNTLETEWFVYFGRGNPMWRVAHGYNNGSGLLNKRKSDSFFLCLPRLATNTRFRRISVELHVIPFDHSLVQNISNIDADTLTLDQGNNYVDVLSLVRNKKNLVYEGWIMNKHASANLVHELYKMVLNNMEALENVKIGMHTNERTKFLNFLGITIDGEEYRSSSNTVEMFHCNYGGIYILDKNVRICIQEILSDLISIKIDRYEDSDDMNKWKETLEKIVVEGNYENVSMHSSNFVR